ncbi:Fanconi anemia group I protein-like [Gigantopelta aegis]|uniref:Fanconi anemia group I protein-like n=1 Tax=Gigantopelta aegis TaxID=1735272 RepID=UPI001B88CE7F|nr:Fanconi anemia group I protein-like [Gigantopelta aegis]
MEKKIVALAEGGHTQDLAQLLNDVDVSQLSRMITSHVLRGKGDSVAFIRALLTSTSSPESTNASTLQLHIYKQLVDILQKNEINTKLASNLVGLLMLECDTLPSESLADLANVFVDSVKIGSLQGGKALDLFPKLMSALASQNLVVFGENSMKGSEYKSHLLNSICSSKWAPASVIHLAAMLRDVPLSLDELRFVIKKILRSFKDLDMQDLPALIYQLLLLANKGHKQLVLEGISKFFIAHDNSSRQKMNSDSEDLMCEDLGVECLRQTEGTVILHVMFAVKQDQDLGREFVKYLKSTQLSSPTHVLEPFNLALALSIARIHRFEDQIFDFLKMTILKSFKDLDRQQQSFCVREVVAETLDVQDLVLETVTNSVIGWDQVMQGLVQLGFLLMDSFGPKAIFGRIETQSVVVNTPTNSACKLGARILINTFKAHEVVRPEILDQIFNRVITKATSPVSHYLDLLADTVKSAPQILLESVPKVREAFDYLSFLPPASAQGLMTAIQPLLKLSMSLKDSLILVLRKSMFSRQVDARKIGVFGFLMIVKNFKVIGGLPSSQCSQPFSLSQIQVDVHRPYNPASNEALCLEIIGNLRRCCSQQADVRLLLYEGLYEVLDRNTQLQAPILDLLLHQIKKYFESEDDVIPPLKLDLSILAQGDQVYLAEPLAHLLTCCQLCVIKSRRIQSDRERSHDNDDDDDDEDEVVHILSELEDLLKSLSKRMATCDMEDFELDKSADFSLANSVGIKNNIYAILVLGTYETLMEYMFVSGQFSLAGSEQILNLYDNYHKLSNVIREKNNTAAGKKGKSSGKLPQSLMSLPCVVSMVKALLSDTVSDQKESLDVLRGNADFVQYVTSVALQKVEQISEKGTCDGCANINKNTVIRQIYVLARHFFTYYVENQLPSEEKRKERGKNMAGLCLDGLVSVFNIVSFRDENTLCQCLVNLEKETDGDVKIPHKAERIQTHIKIFQRLVANILSADEDHQNWKEVASLLTIIGQLTKHLPPGGTQYEQVHAWVFKLCTDQTIDDMATCKLLLGMLLSLSQQMKNLPTVIRYMAEDIHSQLGDIDQEVEVEKSTHFSLIKHRTAAPMVVLLVLSSCERQLDDIDWVVTRIKADTSSNPQIDEVDGTQGLTQLESHEKSICIRHVNLIKCFHELVQSSLPYGVCVETILKTVTKLYSSLSLLVKYYLSLYSNKSGHLGSKFEKLVKLIGIHLTQHVYAMITSFQASEKEHLHHLSEKGKKDKKKAETASQVESNKILKQTKPIPNLIYAIEQFERYLIQLTKKSKINLMENIKISTSRDFRINTAAVQAILEQNAESDNESEEEDAGNNNEDETVDHEASDEENLPPNKRPASPVSTTPPAKKTKLGLGTSKSRVK